MNLFRILTAILFLILCFFIYLCLSDIATSYYLPQLGLISFIFATSFFYEKKYKSGAWTIVFNVFIAVLCGIILVYLKRSDLLLDNEPYSFGRFIYVFGITIISCLIAFLLMMNSYYPEKIRKLKF